MSSEYIFTSESVTEGHPDKLCDQISDALVGQYLRQDPLARVNAECAVSTGILFVSVKAAAEAVVDIPNTAREVILDVGYKKGTFDGRTCTIMTNQSRLDNGYPRADEVTLADVEIEQLVALDNVTLFGFACTHTPALLPLPIWLAHQLVRRLDVMRKGTLDYLAADGKVQVGVAFRNHEPQRISSITLVTSQRKKKRPPSLTELQQELAEQIITPVFANETITPDSQTRIAINPEGIIVGGGPVVHAGLTGRKNDIDTYGGYSRQSGAALSGKDPSRIDRIGAYAARHAAKNIVAAGLATQCEVQLSYSIGLAAPVSVRVECFGTGRLSDNVLTREITNRFDFRVGGIIRRFGLRNLAYAHDGQLYRRLAVYGHVGRVDLDLPWERTDDAAELVAML